MPEYKDWLDLKARHPEQFKKTPVQRSPEAIGDLTTKSRMVIAHPGWQLFLDRLATRQDLLAKQRNVLQGEMVDGDALGPDLERIKLKIQIIKGEEAGLTFAAEIVPAMLEAGERMLRELTSEPIAHAGAMTQGKT